MDLNGRHPSTNIFRRGEDWKCLQLAEEEARAGAATALTTYDCPPTSNTLKVSCRHWMMTVRRCFKNSGRCRRIGRGCPSYWGGRVQILGRRGCSTLQWCRRSLFMASRRGLFPDALGGCWTASATGCYAF